MKTEQLIMEINSKYGEWLEMAGEKSPLLLNNILINLLLREKDRVDFLEKKIKVFEGNNGTRH
jgi:hypothetical protein